MLTFAFAALMISPPAPADTVDLGKIERTIGRLPKFATTSQHYGLLVFGKDAKTRIWVIIDGHRLFIDRNGNGDLTEPGEMVANRYQFLGSITEADGKTTHTNLQIHWNKPHARIEIDTNGKQHQQAGRDKRGRLTFAIEPHKAPIVHFNGPVTMDQFYVQKPLSSKIKQRLSIFVGTPGMGPGTFAAYECVVSCAAARPRWPTSSFPPSSRPSRLSTCASGSSKTEANIPSAWFRPPPTPAPAWRASHSPSTTGSA